MSEKIFQLKIEADLGELKTFRTILIKSTSSLLKLHETIVILFGFKGNLTFGFYESSDTFDSFNQIEIGDKNNYSTINISKPFDNFKCIKYTYDFYHCWDFHITLEKILEKDNSFAYPLCIDSEGGMILDGVGGEYGYKIIADLCRKKINSRKNGLIDYDRNFETLDDEYKNFDPDVFDTNAVNLKLSSILFE